MVSQSSIGMDLEASILVSIPVRGSGKSKFAVGEQIRSKIRVSIPVRGSGKSKFDLSKIFDMLEECFNPREGKW